ncbi:MAG: hypothetical protein ACLTC8_06050 [Lachnospiraceae bacterium]
MKVVSAEKHHMYWIGLMLEYIRQFDFVHSGNYCFMEKELPKIHEAGVPISFDFQMTQKILIMRR